MQKYTEAGRFKKLLADHFDGDPWLEINMKQTLSGITEKEAAHRVGNLNSIWQIVNHVIAWRETLLKRIQNENVVTPQNNFIEPVLDISAPAWAETLARLQLSQDRLLFYLSQESQLSLDELPNDQSYSRWELIQGILQHDVYHLGQIVLIKKLIAFGK
jgi:uncharacterized damage-inducible protein DinB